VCSAWRVELLQTFTEELSLARRLWLQTDVTKFEEVKRLADHAVNLYGRIDVMINNAELMPHSPLEHCKVRDEPAGGRGHQRDPVKANTARMRWVPAGDRQHSNQDSPLTRAMARQSA
jgi:NAD(P)-dependent dehydrogenase (short-subunit alcohol dehydrogenase family)